VRTESGAAVPRVGVYIAIVVVVALVAGVYNVRQRSVFSCEASGYGSDRYLAYCGSTSYGDYDYGAFWFALEPSAREAAIDAKVLFLGNSRMQFALSTPTTNEWFSALGTRYYLLGFAYNANYKFEGPLIQKLSPTAKVYILNLDLFFEQEETPPAKVVLHDADAEPRYVNKREQQSRHRPVCERLPAFCGHEPAFFRSRATGAWVVTGGRFRSKPVSYEQTADPAIVADYTTYGRRFLNELPVEARCQILTMVPTVRTEIGTARAIARALGRELIAPELDGLNTFDESHLDRESAQRWSAAFLHASGPQIRECLADPSSLRAAATAVDEHAR
jgi:hypothetical protein